MLLAYILRSLRRFSVIFAAFCLLVPAAIPTLAQVEVTGFSIPHGTAAVSTTADLSITFNKPLASLEDVELELLDFLAGLDPDAFDDLGIGDIPDEPVPDECATPPAAALVAIIPDFCPDAATISADRKTLTMSGLNLEPDARQTVIVFQAVAEDGSIMEAPALMVMSTAATLPQGSVSGTISSPAAKATIDPSGTMVLLVQQEVIQGVDDGESDPEEGAFLGIAQAGGGYSVDYIPDGNYFALATDPFDAVEGLDDTESALKDIPLGGYDGDGDRILDVVSVEGEAEIEGIDIAVKTDAGTTASDLLGTLKAAVDAESPGLSLSLAGGIALDATGDAAVWTYVFSPPPAKSALASPYFAITLGDQAFPPMEGSEEDDIGFPPVADGWVDSDEAIEFVKDAGGDTFFSVYPDAIGGSMLMDRSFYELVNGLLLGSGLELTAASKALVDARGSADRFIEQIAAHTDIDFSARKTDLVGSVWIMGFVAPSEQSALLGVVDATTGEKLILVSHGSARVNLAAANTVATAWAEDAALVSVATEDPLINASGEGLIWTYTYYSAALDSAEAFLVSHGDAIRIAGMPLSSGVESEDLVSTMPLADGWIDSDAAFSVVRSNRPGFRDLIGQPVLSVELSNGWDEADPTKPMWHFTLEGLGESGEPVSREFSVNALNSTFVNSEDGNVLPSRMQLHQNYPNPFNPSTVIRFELDQPSTATLTVHNVLGREVARLADGLQDRGIHEVRWQPQAGADAAGVYIYRLTAGEFSISKRMVYLP